MEKYILNQNEKKEQNLIIEESNFSQKYSKTKKFFSKINTQIKIITIYERNFFQTIDVLLLKIPK